MIKKLRKNYRVICTSRDYREVIQLAKIRNLKVHVIGKHGGAERSSKLDESLKRMVDLSKIVKKYSPDLTISFCSPEASRISYGLGIKHIAFSDSPHAVAVMRLSVPFVQKLLIPWVIPKKEFIKFGIREKDIIQYKALDAAITLNRKISAKSKLPLKTKGKKTILIRMEESHAAYLTKNSQTSIEIIKKIIKEFSDENILVHARYPKQVKFLKKYFGNKVKVLTSTMDGKMLLENSDVFIGSGGTMTAESALLGVPTISFDAVPNLIQTYLIKKKLIVRETDPKKVILAIKRFTRTPKMGNKRKAKKVFSSMEDPYPKLVSAIKSII